MDASPLYAISPVDGRYAGGTKDLKRFYSEAGLIQYRIRVEVAYLFALAKVITNVDWSELLKHQNTLTSWCENLPEVDVQRVKTIEKTTNHDVKAVEYCIKEKMDALGLQAYKEWVHFGLTSQDINNTAIPLSFKEASNAVMMPAMPLIALSTPANNSLIVRYTKYPPANATAIGNPRSPINLKMSPMLAPYFYSSIY